MNADAVIKAASQSNVALATRVMGVVRECMKGGKHASARPELLMVARTLHKWHSEYLKRREDAPLP